MYNTLNPRPTATPAARRIGLALLTVWTVASAYESFAQGYVPLYQHDDYARVFCTIPQGGNCYGSGPLGLAPADVTGKDSQSLYPDGWLDVAVANQFHSSAQGSVSVFRNTQDWQFNDPTKGLELVEQILLPNPPQGGATATRVAFGRFADDVSDALELDIAVVARDDNNNVSRVYIYMYDGPSLPHYPSTPDYTMVPGSVQRVEGLCVADFDGDGDSDIAVVGNRTDGQTITPRADVLWKGTSQFTQEEISLPAPPGGWGSNPRATDVVAANVRQPPVGGRFDLAITFRPDNWLVRALNTGSTPTWDAGDGETARPALSLAAGRFRTGVWSIWSSARGMKQPGTTAASPCGTWDRPTFGMTCRTWIPTSPPRAPIPSASRPACSTSATRTSTS